MANHQKLIEQLDSYHAQNEHKKILSVIADIPYESRDYAIHLRRARAFHQLKDYDKALDILKSQRSCGESDPEWHYSIGRLHFKLRQYKESFVYFIQAIELGLVNPTTLFYIDEARTKMEEQYIAQTINAMPKVARSLEVQYKLIQININFENYHRAADQLELIAEEDRDEEWYLLSGVVSFQLENYEIATEHFETIVMDNPDYYDEIQAFIRISKEMMRGHHGADIKLH